MTTEEQKEYLLKQLMDSITYPSDEFEGTQAIDLSDLNICDVESTVDMEQPALSADDINKMFHFNDPKILNKFINPDFPFGSNTSSNISAADNISDDENKSLAGDKSQSSTNDDILDSGSNKISNDTDGYKSIGIPDNVDINDVVKSIIDDKSIGVNQAIIEFAQPCIQDETGVDFKLCVKPGQELSQETIIAKATINGVTKEIRSIFDTGTVLANDSNTDFKHLYESAGADRHIIIKDYSICGEAPEIDIEKIQALQDKFTDEAYISQLITDNLPECILPWILQRRYIKPKYTWLGFVKVRINRPNGREIFGKYIEEVQKIREQYSKDIQNLATEDNINATNGNVRKINELGDTIINRRNKYISDMIYMYEEYRNTLDKCEFDEDYSDCKYLAYVHNIDYGKKETYTKIGDYDYNNYYMSLLSKIDIQNENNKYALEYYNLIKQIIEIRMARELYKLSDIQKEFNKIFKDVVNKSIKNAYSLMQKDMRAIKDHEVSYSDVVDWITKKIATKQVDEYIDYSKKQLANMFMFCWNYAAYDTKSVAKGFKRNNINVKSSRVNEIFLLVKEEWKKISEFWKKVLAIHADSSVDKCIQGFKDLSDNVLQYHPWPIATNVTVGNDIYEHYLFQNYTEVDNTLPDEDLGTSYDSKEPEIPTEWEAPQEDLGPDFLLTNDDDVQDGEPTIKDFLYWQKYFALATVLSLPFLNCGLDIPPIIMLVPLPCIFIAISSIYIQMLDLVLVFGISIRGMYIFPIVLYVNCSTKTLTVLTPLIMMLKTIQSKMNAKLNALMELPLTSIANSFINMLEADSHRLRTENKQLDIYIDNIKQQKTKNQQKIKEMFKKIQNPNVDLRQQVVDPIGNMLKAKNTPTNE